MQLSKTMKILRKRIGLNQAQLGHQLGVSDAFVCQIEKGKRTPAREYFRKFAGLVAYCDGLTEAESLYDELLILDLQQRDPELYDRLCFHFPISYPRRSKNSSRKEPSQPVLFKTRKGRNRRCL